MARSARREPTIRELDERLTTVERELAQVVSTVTSINQAAISEAKWVRDAIIETRDEVRRGFAETATRTDVAALRTELGTVRSDVATVRTDVASLRTEVTAIRSDLNELRDSMDKGFAEVLDEVRKRPE